MSAEFEAEGMAEVPREMTNYGRVGNGEKLLLRWLLYIASGALLLALAGSWAMWGALSGVKQEVADFHEQDHDDIQRLYQFVEAKNANRP